MSKIQILDCTLRDGGYINDFNFGKGGIKKIIGKLTVAGIDIIETGFLENGEYDSDCSIYNTVEQISKFIPEDRGNSMYVAMACYGEYDIEQLSPYDGTSIDGIRVTFHYNEIEAALEYCREIQAKGYKVFVQPVGTSSYSDEQLLKLIKKVNEIRPYSFYLVDTLGLMHEDEVMRFFYLINHNLASSIHMGFHSHNNLQLSFSNCQALVSIESDRTISLDASVYGMGRGAGNLNTELIANYLNEHCTANYEIEPLLEIVDEHIVKIKRDHEWGYSVPYYLAAINGCHPNYAAYLSGKNTLNVRCISAILHMLEPESRALFNKNLIEEKYLQFQSNEIDDRDALAKLTSYIAGHNVLLLAPGESIRKDAENIIKKAEENNCIIISTSFVPDFINPDFVFISNLKRYNTTFNPSKKKVNLINTSNIKITNNSIQVNYSSLLNPDDRVRDNSSLMLLNLLMKLKPSKVFIAGMDGYSVDKTNYYQDRLTMEHDKEKACGLNSSISKRLKQIGGQLDICFITPTLYL